MKKLIFLLLLIIPISCIAQGKHKNGVIIWDYNGTDTVNVIIDTAGVILEVSQGGITKSIIIDTTRMVIIDNDNGIGLEANEDYTQGFTSLAYTHKEYQDLHLGGQNLNSTVYSPTGAEHGAILTYDSTGLAAGTDQYVLTDVVEVGQAAGLVVEDCDTVLFSNTTQTTTVTLPAAAVISDIFVYVATAFDGSGTDLLDIGITGSGNRYEDNLDISSTGFKTMTLTNVRDRMGANTNITFQYFDSNADAANGEAYVYVRYAIH